MDDRATALVCNYCSAASDPRGGPLLACASCRVAAYCCAEHQTLDWNRHKVWCKVHTSRTQSAAGSSERAASSSAASAATPRKMESMRRNDSVPQTLSDSMALMGQQATLAASTSGSSQTSGHSSGTDGSSMNGNATIDPLAALIAQLGQQQQQQVQPQLLQLPQPIDPAVILAAANQPNFYSSLALFSSQLTQHAQQQEQLQQQQQQQAAAAAVALPQPALFPPIMGSLAQLGLTGFSVPPPPSAFPSAAAFDPNNAAALIAAITTLQQQQQQQQNLAAIGQQPRFDLGATDTTPLLNFCLPSMSSASSSSSTIIGAHHSFTTPFSSSSLIPSSITPSIPFGTSITKSHPTPFVASQRSSMEINGGELKPSTTSNQQYRVKAVATRRSGSRPVESLPTTAAAAAAAAGPSSRAADAARAMTDDGMWSGSTASTSSYNVGAATSPTTVAPVSVIAAPAPAPEVAGSVKMSPDRYERPEGTRKRTTPSPDDKKCVFVDNRFLMTMPLDMLSMNEKGQAKAGVAAPEGRRKVEKKMEIDDDDEIQVISQKINRRYRDHTQNVVYNVTVNEHMTAMRNKGYLLSRHQATVLRLRYIAEHVIRSLNEFGWAVVDNYLGTDHVEHCAKSSRTSPTPEPLSPQNAEKESTQHYDALRKEMEKLYEKGIFTAGQLMENSEDEDWNQPVRSEDDIKNVRSDYIYWYDGVDERATEAVTTRLLISMLDAMILHFEDRIEGKQIGGRSRAMLAIYPGGESRYVKHVDNPNLDGRLITCIYYCNANWNLEEHGGALRLFPETSECPMDIDPQADRLVFFWSDRRNPHEVMPVHRHRFAVTIWYMEKTERNKANAKKKIRREAIAAARAAGLTREDVMRAHPREHRHRHDHEALRVIIEQPQLGALMQFGSMRPTHNSTPRMGDAGTAASIAATALGLPRAAAAIGRTASPRSRSDNNMARRFEVARSECTQDASDEEVEEFIPFIPKNTESDPDYQI